MNSEDTLRKVANLYEDPGAAYDMLVTGWAKGNKALCDKPFGEVKEKFVFGEEELYKKRIANRISRKSHLLQFALAAFTHVPTRHNALHR